MWKDKNYSKLFDRISFIIEKIFRKTLFPKLSSNIFISRKNKK